MRARAVIFDFNGTLSHDEPILLAIFQELFAEYGRPLSAEEYFDELAGRSDPEIVRTWLGADHPAVDEVIERRVDRYRELAADGSTVPEEVREAVRFAAERVPVAVVSGAARAEIEPVLEAAGLAGHVRVVVAAEDVRRGKPAPDGYLRALELLDGGLVASNVLVFEDAEARHRRGEDGGDAVHRRARDAPAGTAGGRGRDRSGARRRPDAARRG